MKIVILDGYTLNPGDLSWEKLQSIGEVTVYDRTALVDIITRAQDAEIILTNKTPIRAEVIASLPKLKYIGVLATGYDIIDVQAAAERGIVVANTPGYGSESVAQMVFALLLELCHHAGAHSESVRDGEWSSNKDFCYWKSPLIELHNKTIGIVGYGRIGQQVGQIAQAFGMKVVALQSGHKKVGEDSQSEEGNSNSGVKSENLEGKSNGGVKSQDGEVRRCDWEELLSISDVVSLHCPLTPETEGIINRGSLSLMKKSALIINTSRGKLIVEQDLADALNQGRIAGAGLDVLSSEPPIPEHPLFTASNCIITPHISWATKEARERLLGIVCGNIEGYLAGEPRNVISKR